MTNAQIERVQKEIKELTAKLEKVAEKLNRTLEIMKEDASWEMFLEEDKKWVDYYKSHINRLNDMIKEAA
jgi:archaellum component FlaC